MVLNAVTAHGRGRHVGGRLRPRPARLPRWAPLDLGWLGSGSLFAWSAWRLLFTSYVASARPAGTQLPEDLAVAAVVYVAAVAAGAVMLSALVRPSGSVAAPGAVNTSVRDGTSA